MKVLFLGNSHTFFNDMPQIFKNICAEKGKDVEVGMLAHPGVTYGWHFKQFTDLRFALMWGGYDYIVMQQAAHSPCPAKEETLEDGGKIIDLARKMGVTPIQTMPWAEKRDPDHQKGMYDIYNTLSEQYGVKLTVAGNVFEDVFYNYPDIDMYFVDGEHASPYGSYTIALAAYAAIFGESVKGVSPNSYRTYVAKDGALKNVLDKEEAFFPLEPEKAAKLQELVDKHEFGK